LETFQIIGFINKNFLTLYKSTLPLEFDDTTGLRRFNFSDFLVLFKKIPKIFLLRVRLFVVLTHAGTHQFLESTSCFSFGLEFTTSSIGSWVGIYQQSSGVFVFHETHLK